MRKIKVDDERIIEACKNNPTMAKAAAETGLHFNTFKRYAERLGCYRPNPGSKGIKRNWVKPKYDLDEILEGKHPHYQTFKLKLRIFKEKIKEEKCEDCGIESWNGKWIPLELDHINGESRDHRLENLRILCPNCHSQTSTFRAKNRK